MVAPEMSRAIVMTVCQRPFYLEPTLIGWSQARDYKDWPFIFMVENTPTADAMVEIINQFDHPNKTVIRNPVRYGVLENPFQGLELAFSQGYEYVVLAEEDLLPSTNILEFFDVSWDILAEDESVLAACAQGCPSPEEQRSPTADSAYDLELKPTFKVWLWATTRDNWYAYIRDTWDHDYSTGDQYRSGWDWNLQLSVVPDNNLTCVFPKTSLVDNLGQWLGAHAAPDSYDDSRPPGFIQHREQRAFTMTRPKIHSASEMSS